MELILDNIRDDDGQFSDLMTQRVWVIASQGFAATATGSGFARDDLTDLIGPDQGTLLTRMARLSTRLLFGAVGRGRRATFAVKAIRGRRQGGIRGIGGQFGLSLSELLLELLDLQLLLLAK